jgi:hypothetical protein
MQQFSVARPLMPKIKLGSKFMPHSWLGSSEAEVTLNDSRFPTQREKTKLNGNGTFQHTQETMLNSELNFRFLPLNR